ncbi:MAG: hypothetical protein KGO05_05805 [Chloroflexota bacterium]|nr:hypothetical protein [Chloroflexota bacterium]
MPTDEIGWATVSALALIVMAFAARWAWRRSVPHARLCALGLLVGWLTLGAALLAVALGAESDATGRFLVGMSVGVALGMALGSAIILAAGWRGASLDLRSTLRIRGHH